MPTIQLPNNWQPREYQRAAWEYLENGGKRAVLAWHRRAGKDDILLRWASVAVFQRPATYWHMLPEASQARKAIWNAVNPHTGKRRIDEAFPLPLRKRTLENDMFIEFANGATWQVIGSDNFDSLVGAPPAGVTFSEYALADPRAWALLRPILLENDGWALFISTARGRNHFKSLFDFAATEPGWFAQKLTVDDTGIFTPDRLAAELREMVAEHGDDGGNAFFRQEYYNDFSAALLGTYYGREMERADDDGRITRVPADPGVPCITAWDLGIGDSTVIVICQVVGLEVRVVDVIAGSGVGLEWYAQELAKRGLLYEEHLLPHDAGARELGTGRTREETLRALKIGKTRILPVQSVADGINATRRLLPALAFDKERCGRLVEALRVYRREWNDATKTFHDKPKHDWASHFADSVRVLAMGLRRSVTQAPVGINTRAAIKAQRMEAPRLGWVV